MGWIVSTVFVGPVHDPTATKVSSRTYEGDCPLLPKEEIDHPSDPTDDFISGIGDHVDSCSTPPQRPTPSSGADGIFDITGLLVNGIGVRSAALYERSESA